MTTLMMSVFIALQIIDCLQTSWIIKNGGIVESQTLLQMCHRLGVGLTLAIVKGSLIIAVLLAWNDPLTFILCLLYAMKMGHNVYSMSGKLL